ncbi:MAG: DUF1800 domain-containing protein [bacterium]|nr:DUF1800 domain-containing protein [bacterium]
MPHPRPSPSRAPSRRELLGRSGPAAMAAAGAMMAPVAGAPAQPPRVAMRSPRRRRPARPKAVPAPPSAAVIALTRMAFGPRPGDVEAFNSLAGTDSERLTAYVDQQLDPASIDDSVAEARIAQAGFTTLGKTLVELWEDHMLNDQWEEHMRPFYETVLMSFLRAIWSKRQLVEVLADFWHNHFNVFADDFLPGPVWVHTDRDAVRAHLLGNFRQMLEAVAKTPAMLYYLNNNENSQDGPNENYARELLELHALGVENYLGSIPRSQVPLDDQGRPIGYVDEDVTAAARCLTGWTVRDRPWDPEFGDTGAFFYYDPWHDQGAKTILGVELPANQAPMTDGTDLLDLAAEHPGTGRHLARKLCRRLISDDPPQSVVDAAAAVFTAQVDAPDQLAQVVRTILLSDEFLSTWGEKIKRPFEIAVSALRGAQGDLPFRIGDPATEWFLWMVYQTGQALFSWRPPDGYPDRKEAWTSTSPRVMSWRLANMLIEVQDETDHFYVDVFGQTPAGVRSAHDLVTFWAERILGRPPAAAEQEELIDFMAQGHNPHFDLPLDSDDNVRDRLRALIALIFMSPSFHWR